MCECRLNEPCFGGQDCNFEKQNAKVASSSDEGENLERLVMLPLDLVMNIDNLLSRVNLTYEGSDQKVVNDCFFISTAMNSHIKAT